MQDDGWDAAPGAATRPLPVARDLFDIPDDVAYFNCASLCAQLHTVRRAGQDALASRAAPWRIKTQDWFTGAEERRELFARLAGVDPEGVALVPATSYGLAVAAANLSAGPGQQILVLDQEYPSNYYTWRAFAVRTGAALTVVSREAGQSWTDAVVARLDEQTAVVAVPACHWTDGAMLDLLRIARRARHAGAALVIDASQALGALPLDLAAIRPDFVVSVGYKWLLGPFGLGYLYVAEQHRDGTPLEQNWISRRGAEDFAALVGYQDAYQPGARRFDVGGRTHFETTPMAIAALRQLLAWGQPAIAATLATITARIDHGIRSIGLRPTSADHGPHMLGVALPGNPQHVAAALTRAGVYAGLRGECLRISPHLWTTDQDIERLLTELANQQR